MDEASSKISRVNIEGSGKVARATFGPIHASYGDHAMFGRSNTVGNGSRA